ncbi:outer membrane lipoprotein-sorting protein [Telmatobacter bradus]|uniref:outer membrane lipoprotein-sorting protein n=1 Tax=Telmatobacter bradus TaxID=474953 RepID=UPI003B42A084
MFKTLVIPRILLQMFVMALLLCSMLRGHAATPDAVELLRHSDIYRNGWSSFTLRVKITNFENGNPDEERLYGISQKGTEKTYVDFLSPRDKGSHLLMLGDDMWIFLPDTSRPMRITPLERLAGNASNGDVARTNYAADYTPVYQRTEMLGTVNCYLLELTAKRKGSTYQRILYWLRAEDARPVRAEFYLTSGKHIKSASFDEYVSVDGRMQLRRMTLYDEIRHNSHSVLEYSNYTPRELPDKLFYQGRAERF